jgi:hypothetical protein
MRTRAGVLLAVLIGLLPSPASAQALASGMPGTRSAVLGECEQEARNGGGAQGCYWNASINLGPMPGQLYWNIDRFHDAESALAARSLYGVVTIALGGQIFLQTVSDNPGWRPEAGEHIATIGPLTVPNGTDLTARFMEATSSAGNGALVGARSGPTALVLLEGSLCVETSAGAVDADAGESLVLPAHAPMQLSASGTAMARTLLLAVVPTSEAGIANPPGWTPSGLCRP